VKRKYILISAVCLCLAAALLWLALPSGRYVCRPAAYHDDPWERLPEAEAGEPLLGERATEFLLTRAVRRELEYFRPPLSLETVSRERVSYAGRDAESFILRVRDSEGFVAVITMMILPRW